MFRLDERTPSYYAVIPASVRYDDQISANAKLLYGEISALIGNEGFCYAKNAYFAQLFKISERSVSRLISALQEGGYIVVQLERDKSGQVTSRKLFLSESTTGGQPLDNIVYTPRQNCREGMDKNVQYTNTSNTSIYKENIKEKSEKKERVPKTDFDPLPLFVEWIGQTFGNTVTADDKNALYFALARFSENRQAIKKPMKSKGSVTALCNRLLRLTHGLSAPHLTMIELLDLATTNNWQSVYPSKDAPVPRQSNPRPGRVYEEL